MITSKSRLPKEGLYFKSDHLMSDLKNQAVKGAGATVFSQVSVYGIQMIGTIILARLLSPADFGLVAMVTTFSLLFQNFGMRGFTEATIQSDEISHEMISTIFWINIVLSSILSIIFIALSPFIAWFYNEPRLKLISIAISINFIFNALSTQHLALLKRNMQFYKVTLIEIAAAITSVTIALSLACYGWSYWSLVGRRIFLIAAVAVGSWIFCKWSPGMPSLQTEVRAMIKFAINTYGNFTLNYFSRNLDKILIGWRHGTQSLGNYERAYYLFVMPVNQLSYPLTNVAVAALSRLRNDPGRFRQYYLEALSMIAFIGMLLSAVLTLIGRDFILLLLGTQWSKAGDIFTVFAPGIGIMLVYGSHGWLHLSLGRADRWLRWGIIELIATVLSFFIGLPFGALGVAIAYTISFYVLIGPGLLYAGNPIGIKLSSLIAVVWKYYVSALISGLACWIVVYSFDSISVVYFKLNIFFRIFVTIFLCSSAYLVLVVAFYRNFKPISKFISLLNDMIPKIRMKISTNLK